MYTCMTFEQATIYDNENEYDLNYGMVYYIECK